MLDVATIADPVHDQEDGDRGHEDDHRQSPHGDSASSITPLEEHVRGRGRDNRDLRDVIHDRDACGQIENWR
jgi:molybdopterin-guanine dinucleotide biosynthesis protein